MIVLVNIIYTNYRLFIIAAAPYEKLPMFPDPENSFDQKPGCLDFYVDDKRYSITRLISESAPYRTLTVKDAISDLPYQCQEVSGTTTVSNSINYSENPKRLVRCLMHNLLA